MKKALKFQADDNVVVALEDLKCGDVLCINGEASDVTVLEDLPQGHKVAICDIKTGEKIRKYDHVIGSATVDIAKGGYVHVHNVQDTITDWRSNIHHEYDPNG